MAQSAVPPRQRSLASSSFFPKVPASSKPIHWSSQVTSLTSAPPAMTFQFNFLSLIRRRISHVLRIPSCKVHDPILLGPVKVQP